jgi:hypothetical protein
MNVAVPLITLTELKQRLNVDPSFTGADFMLGDCIQLASSDIETTCRRSFAYQTRVEYFYSRGVTQIVPDVTPYGGCTNSYGFYAMVDDQKISLSAIPVDLTASFQLQYDTSRQFTDPRTTVNPVDYQIDPDTGNVILTLGTHRASNSIKVSYSGGYAIGTDGTLSASAPLPLKIACITQARFLYGKLNAGNLGLDTPLSSTASEVKNRARFVVQGGLIPESFNLVSPYIRTLTGRA